MSDSEYKRVLTTWALSVLPAYLGAVRVTDATADYWEGWGGSDVTPGDDPELTINIRYVTADGEEHPYMLHDNTANAVRLTKLLQALFKIADGT